MTWCIRIPKAVLEMQRELTLVSVWTGTKLKGVRRGGLERRSPRVTEWGQLQRPELGSRSGRDTGSGSLQVDLGAPLPSPECRAALALDRLREPCGQVPPHLWVCLCSSL